MKPFTIEVRGSHMRVVLSLHLIILARRTVLGDTTCEDEDEDDELSGGSEDVHVRTGGRDRCPPSHSSAGESTSQKPHKATKEHPLRVLTNPRFKFKKSKTIPGRIMIFYPGYVHRKNINGGHIFYVTYLNLKPPGH